jgi:hypothetical protein
MALLLHYVLRASGLQGRPCASGAGRPQDCVHTESSSAKCEETIGTDSEGTGVWPRLHLHEVEVVGAKGKRSGERGLGGDCRDKSAVASGAIVGFGGKEPDCNLACYNCDPALWQKNMVKIC